MKKLIIENDVIVNIIEADDNVANQDEWIKALPTATGNESIGWVSDGQGGYVAPSITLEEAKEAKHEMLASVRWQKEQGGFTNNGIPYKSSDRDRGMVADAKDYLQNSSRTTIRFKMADGARVPLTIEQVSAIGVLIGDHIQDCFDREEELELEIEAATTLQELEAIDLDSGWPS